MSIIGSQGAHTKSKAQTPMLPDPLSVVIAITIEIAILLVPIEVMLDPLVGATVIITTTVIVINEMTNGK